MSWNEKNVKSKNQIGSIVWIAVTKKCWTCENIAAAVQIIKTKERALRPLMIIWFSKFRKSRPEILQRFDVKTIEKNRILTIYSIDESMHTMYEVTHSDLTSEKKLNVNCIFTRMWICAGSQVWRTVFTPMWFVDFFLWKLKENCSKTKTGQ